MPRQSQIERMMWAASLKTNKIESHVHWVHASVFGNQSDVLATASQDCTATIWRLDSTDTDSPRHIQQLGAHTGTVRDVTFSSDDHFVATASYDKTCKIWNVSPPEDSPLPYRNTTPKANLVHDSGFVFCCSWAHNSLATGCEDFKVRCWDPTAEKCVTTMHGHEAWVWSCDFVKSGKILATGSYDNSCRLWDSRSKSPLIAELSGHKDYVYSTKFTMDGQFLATCSADKTWRLWDVRQRQQIIKKSGHDDWIWDIALLPAKARCVTACRDGTISFWDLYTAAEVKVIENAHEGAVRTVNFSSDGCRLVSGGTDNIATVWTATLEDAENPENTKS